MNKYHKKNNRNSNINDAEAIIQSWKKHYFKKTEIYMKETIRDLMQNEKLYYRDGDKFCEITSAWLYWAQVAMPMAPVKSFYLKNRNGFNCLKNILFSRVRNYIGNALTKWLSCPGNIKDTCVGSIMTRFLKSNISTNMKDYIEYIYRNIYYQDLAFVKKRNQVMDKIPSDVTLLFPEAREIKRHFVLHVGDTNTGKTYDAMKELAAAKTGGYFAPLRLLALEGQEKLLAEGVNCSMRTGEEDDTRPGSTHVSCTVEMLDTSQYYDLVVIDEAQMIEDENRGYAWTNAILGCYCPLIHVCMSENALNIIIKMINSCGDTYEIVKHKRNTELIFEDTPFDFPADVREDDAVVLFSRKDVLAAAAELEKRGWRPSVIYGSLPYNARKEEMRRFKEHETNVVVATDAIGMGINMPIHRIVFLRSSKYDGNSNRPLTVPEIKQIAGRAGRQGIFNEGYVNTAIDRSYIKKQLFKNYEDIQYAGIQIPDSLFSLPITLSETLKEWTSIEDVDIYKKVSNKYRIQMCEWLEEEYPDFSKEAMWSFLCIPYDERNLEMQREWMSIVSRIAKNESIEDGLFFEDISVMKLNDCEQYYKKLDLYFSFARLFGEKYTEFQNAIAQEKEEVSLKIMEELKQSKTDNSKTCKYCGRPLSVMYPYKICQRCFQDTCF